jgi:tetratricopeptide (TPR) repeat protein
LDPISVLANQFVARAHYFARRFDQAIEISRKTIEIDPNASISHLRLGRAYAAKGMYPLAIKEFEEFGRLSGDDSLALASIGNTKGQAKDHAGAMRALNELTEISKQKKVPAICFVLVHVGLGNEDQGMAWLDTAYKERSDFLLVLKVDVLFDPLRSDPRFVDLERRVGVP